VLESLGKKLWAHRRRIAPLVIGAAVLVVGTEYQRHAPRDVEVELPLGDDHARIQRVDVSFLEDRDLVRQVSLRYPDGAPEHVRQTVELAPGRYDVAVELTGESGATEARVGALEAPGEGVIRVSLRDPS
jgi:hypothetical protein